MKRRDWGPARAKVDAEGRCRGCNRTDRKLDAAHLWHRSVGGGMDPDLIVPLCGPVTDSVTCHARFDGHGKPLDLLGRLSADEEIAVIRAASVNGGPGLERARRRLYPTAYEGAK